MYLPMESKTRMHRRKQRKPSGLAEVRGVGKSWEGLILRLGGPEGGREGGREGRREGGRDE
jgi:hypothetical protein